MTKHYFLVGASLLLAVVILLSPYRNWPDMLQASTNAQQTFLPIILQDRATPSIRITTSPRATRMPIPTATSIASTATPADSQRTVINQIIPPGYPLTFDLNDPNNYRSYPLFGSATRANGDIIVRVSLEVQAGANAPSDAANGVFFGNHDQRVYLAYQQGVWKLIHGDGETYPIGRNFAGMNEPNAELTLHLTQQNRIATVTLPDGEEVIVDLGRSIFSPDETVYLFAQTAPNSMTTVKSAQIEQQPTGEYDAILALADPPLRSLTAPHGITYGSIHDTSDLGTWLDFALLDHQADLLVWHLGWSYANTNAPLENAYDELRSSTRVAHAKTVGQRVRVHPLIWYQDIPNWVINGNFSAAELENIMGDRITSLMTKHKAEEWVVVNEAIVDGEESQALRSHIFQDTFGEEHLDMAFHFARAADPDAILIYNDYGVEEINTKSDRMYDLLSRMLARGAPVDGVGLQFHMLGCEGTTTPTKAQYKENMARFAELGLDVYVTELDVNLNGLTSNRDEKWAQQATIYRDVTEACLETPACKSVTTWGQRDLTSWWYRFPTDAPCGDDPLLFEDDYSPKPAYFAMQNALIVQPTPEPPDTSYAIQQSAILPIIDGEIDPAWYNVPEQSLTNWLLNDPVFYLDLDATFQAIHDANYLYIFVEVTDLDLVNDSGEEWWEDDGIEIYIDGDRSRQSSYDGVNDYQLVFRWDDANVIAGPNSLAAPSGLRWARSEIERGYWVEIAIPLAEVGIEIADGTQFGLDVHVSDDDSGVRESKIAWHGTADENWHDPTIFGSAQLNIPSQNPSRIQLEAEAHDAQSGVETYDDIIGYVDGGDWIRFDNVDLVTGYATLRVRYAKGHGVDTSIQVHLDSLSNSPFAQITTADTGGWDNYIEATVAITTEAMGVHDLYFSFHGSEGVGNIDWLAFEERP